MSQANDAQKLRRHYRIHYPVPDRPELIINGRTYIVDDLSQSGLRFMGKNASQFTSDTAIMANLIFKSGHRLFIRGKVLKVGDEWVVVTFEDLISKDILKVEADILLKKYGNVPTQFS